MKLKIRTVGILIVFFDDLDKIESLTNALNSQTYKHFTVYITDNQPLINHIELFKKYFPGCTVVNSNTNTGFAGGNNLLARKAIEDSCTYLWILNPDMEPQPDALEKLVEFLNAKVLAGIVGPLLLKGDTKKEPVIQLYGARVNFKTQNKKELYAGKKISEIVLPKVLETDIVNAGSFLIRSNLTSGNYLFDERYFMYNDEIDLAKRVKEKLYRIYVLSDARVWHHHNWSSSNKSGYNLMYYYMMRNRILYFRKFGLHVQLLLDIVKQIILFPIILQFCIKTSGPILVKYYYTGLFHGLMNKKGKACLQF
jgi:GT2 family glycosyltransferase